MISANRLRWRPDRREPSFIRCNGQDGRGYFLLYSHHVQVFAYDVKYTQFTPSAHRRGNKPPDKIPSRQQESPFISSPPARHSGFPGRSWSGRRHAAHGAAVLTAGIASFRAYPRFTRIAEWSWTLFRDLHWFLFATNGGPALFFSPPLFAWSFFVAFFSMQFYFR